RVLAAAETQIGHYHGLLDDLPLGVAAAHAVNLALDGLEVSEGARMISGREGGDALGERVTDLRHQVALGGERAQAVEERAHGPLVAARRVGERGVHVAEDEAGPRHLGRPRRERPPARLALVVTVEPEPPEGGG